MRKPIRMAIYQNETENNNFWQGYTLLTETETGAITSGNRTAVPQNTYTKNYPLLQLLDYIPKELKAGSGTGIYTPNFTALFTGQS